MFREAGLVAGFGSRLGGRSRGRFATANISLSVGDDPADVRDNRARFAARVGLADADITTVRQCHSALAVEVFPAGVAARHGSPSMHVAADGMITTAPAVALLVGVADCAPVLLLDPVRRAVAALHVGRKGLFAGIVAAGLAGMRAAGGRAGATIALIGPAIGPCCYGIDLRAGIRSALRGEGVCEIVEAGTCTCCSPQVYFSRRRDGPGGTQGGIVGIPHDE